jgi:hypothetical protein
VDTVTGAVTVVTVGGVVDGHVYVMPVGKGKV